MEMVRLKNGAEEAQALVSVTMLSLKKLAEENPIALYELAKRAANRDHEFFGDAEETLYDLRLVGTDGQPHGSIRNIVLSAVKIEETDFHLLSPIAEE